MVDFKNDSNEKIQAYIQKQIDDAIKKDRAKRKREGDRDERLSRMYEEDKKNLGSMTELMDVINKQTKEYRDSLRQLGGEGAFFVKGGPLQEGLEATIKKMDELTASPEAGAQAFKQLTVQLKNFSQLAKATEDAQGGLAAALSTQAAVLKDLGLSYGSFTKNVDFAIFSMGQSKESVQALNSSLVNLSKQIGMLPDDVSRNFQMVAKNLAYSFTGIKDQFVKIQKLSAETGVSIDNLMGKFGRPMDTISGASEMAARINSLLGRNAFSATQLLTMSEEERMTSIRGALMDSGIAGQALGGGLRGKFALQSVNEVLGLGIDDTRRFLQTGGLKADISDKVRTDFEGSSDQFTQATKESARALEDFTDIILRFLKPATEQAIKARRDAIRDPGFLQGAGIVKNTGETGVINEAMGNSLAFRDIMFLFRQDEGRAKRLGIDEKRMLNLAAAINAGGDPALAAREQLRQLAIQLGPGSGIRGGLTPLQQSIINKTTEQFGLRQMLINQFRSNPMETLGFTKADSGKIDSAVVKARFEEKFKGGKTLEELEGSQTGVPQVGGSTTILRPNFSYKPVINVNITNGAPADKVLVEHLEPTVPGVKR